MCLCLWLCIYVCNICIIYNTYIIQSRRDTWVNNTTSKIGFSVNNRNFQEQNLWSKIGFSDFRSKNHNFRSKNHNLWSKSDFSVQKTEFVIKNRIFDQKNKIFVIMIKNRIFRFSIKKTEFVIKIGFFDQRNGILVRKSDFRSKTELLKK